MTKRNAQGGVFALFNNARVIVESINKLTNSALIRPIENRRQVKKVNLQEIDFGYC